jgi:NifB/MoaA-like Fe-S oxidoreductase
MTRGKASACGSIESVLPASVAGRVGLQPGDCLVAVNGHEVRDVIDAQLYAAEEELRLEFLRGDALSSVTVSRAYDEPLGLEFRDLLFDGIRTCRNRCDPRSTSATMTTGCPSSPAAS